MSAGGRGRWSPESPPGAAFIIIWHTLASDTSLRSKLLFELRLEAGSHTQPHLSHVRLAASQAFPPAVFRGVDSLLLPQVTMPQVHRLERRVQPQKGQLPEPRTLPCQ